MADVNVKIVSSFDDKGSKAFQKEASKSGKIIKGLGKAFKVTALAGGALFAGAAAGAIAFGKQSVDLAKEQIRVEAQLAATLESTGNAAGLTAEQIKNMASELQGITNFGDEATLVGQNLLLTFTNIGGETFPRATAAMLDMSVAMEQDVSQSAIQLGKALNDPVKGLGALSRVGVQFSEEQEKLVEDMVAAGDAAGAQALILAELETQFGGSAAAAREADGGMIAFSNAFGDLQEEIGKAVLPTLSDSFATMSQFLVEAQPVVLEFAGNLQNTLGPAMALIQDAVLRIATAFGFATEETSGMDLALKILEGGLGVIVTGLQAVAIAAQGIAFVVEKVKEAIELVGSLTEQFNTIQEGGGIFGQGPGTGGFAGGIPGFQGGGSFTVGGSGGPDSQLVAFRATPGEPVNVGQGGGVNITVNASGGVNVAMVEALLQQFVDEVLIPQALS